MNSDFSFYLIISIVTVAMSLFLYAGLHPENVPFIKDLEDVT